MSLQESPLSDSKMDISDVTTSLDSAGVSPAEDDETDRNTHQSPLSPPHHNHNNHSQADDHKQIAAKNTQNEDDIDIMQHTKSLHLDNDNRIIRPEILSLEQPIAQRHNIARTLANSHPLMSPTGTDSESDQSQLPSASDIKCHNFPDVIPQYEHIQAPVPIPLPPNAVTARNTLNNIRGKVISTAPAHNKLTLLRAHSPDLLSSESDADVSQYHAAVEANFQSVALIPTTNNSTTHKGARRVRKTCVGVNAALCDDISSLDSISNHSFDDDEDLEHNLASLSPSSSLIDGLDDDDDDDDCEGPELMPAEDDDDEFPEATTPTPNARSGTAAGNAISADALPQYSAAEERRDSRNWQKITLPDGLTREIDMRVIEPYKRVLSHGGYLKAGGHNAIVIFCACHLPDRSRADYNYVMDNLFLYVVKTLEQLVTEDYVLIYLHGGTNRRNVPPFPWLKKCYQLLDRRLRKSLKNMYLVHPTFWIKSIVWMARPFVSAKFWRKLVYVKSLEELGTHIAVERAAIPEKVKLYDAKHNN